MCDPATAAVVGGSLLAAKEQKSASNRANSAMLNRQMSNARLTHDATLQQATLESEARQRQTNAALSAIDAQQAGNETAGNVIQDALSRFRPDAVKNQIQGATGEAVGRMERNLSEADAQGLRATQSGVGGNVSEAYQDRSQQNSTDVKGNAQRLTNIYGGLGGIAQAGQNQSMDITDLAASLRQVYGEAEAKKRAAMTKGYIDGQAMPFVAPMIDNSPIEVRGPSGLGQLIQAGGQAFGNRGGV